MTSSGDVLDDGKEAGLSCGKLCGIKLRFGDQNEEEKDIQSLALSIPSSDGKPYIPIPIPNPIPHGNIFP